jgi:prepilin-type N-terminal cleavage/methylation domain-containing protein
MIKLFKKNNKGFTLVETLVAISIFSMSVLGLLIILSNSIADTSYAKQKITAGYLAQEGIEYLRNMRDTYVLYSDTTSNDWGKFKAKLAPCNSGNECGFSSAVPTTDPGFIFKCSSGNCKLYMNNGAYDTSGGGADSGFTRKIWMTTTGTDQVKIFSSVSWIQGSGSYSIIFSENLFNWYDNNN